MALFFTTLVVARIPMKTLGPLLPPSLHTGLVALLLLSVSPAIPASSGAAPAAGTAPVAAGGTIRIIAGQSAPLTDEKGGGNGSPLAISSMGTRWIAPSS